MTTSLESRFFVPSNAGEDGVMTKQTKTNNDQPTGSERRVHRRFTIRGATVQYFRVGLVASDLDPRGCGKLTDVSEGGMQFLSDEPLAQGDMLSLCLMLPRADEALTMRGHVVWAEPVSSAEQFRIGVKFTMCSARAAFCLRSLAEQACCKRRVRVRASNRPSVQPHPA